MMELWGGLIGDYRLLISELGRRFNKDLKKNNRNTVNQLPKFCTLRLARPLVALLLVFTTALAAVGQQVVDYSTSGTWVCPAGVTAVSVECWGSGGAGGAVGGNPAAAGGGAGGAYARKLVPVVPGTTYSVTVGAKKWSGAKTATAIENTGNPSWFGSVSTVYAQGGAGTAGGGDTNSFNGTGALGSASASIGDIVWPGGNGADGASASGVAGGAGGGSAGTAGAGGNASGVTGGIGGSGNPSSGTGAVGPNNSQSGADGLIYGGGGAGGKANGSTDRNGGAGAPGFVRLSFVVGSAPNAPTALSVIPTSATGARLSWTDNANDETGFEIERSTTAGSGYVLVATTGIDIGSYTDLGLQAANTYYYRIRAINAIGGSSYTASVSVTTPSPVVYNAAWTELTNMSVNADNSLTKSGANGWNASATSFNVLEPYMDGYVAFTYPGGTTSSCMISLSRQNGDVSYLTQDYTIYINGNTAYIYESGQSVLNVGTITTGTLFEIVRSGNSIQYKRNGTAIRTLGTSSELELRIDVASNIGSVPKVTCSFPSRPVLTAQLTYPTGANANGAINLTVAGGTVPYTYAWSSGEQTEDITGKTKNKYTVTVTDALGKVVSRTYDLTLYSVGWTNLVKATVNADNSLSRIGAGTNWDAAAVSYNILDEGQDGFVQFTYNTGRYMVALSKFNNDVTYNMSDYAFYIETDNIYVFELGVNVAAGGFGKAVAGDIFKVAREGNTIKYFKNSTLLKTTYLNYNYFTLRADVSIYTGTITSVQTSFDQTLYVVGSCQQPAWNATNGAITLNVTGGTAPYTYIWSTGEQASSISNKGRGSYSVTVTDAAGRVVNKTYGLGYSPEWTDFQNATALSSGGLQKVTASSQYDAAAASTNLLLPNTNGYIEFTVADLGQDYLVGFSGVNSHLAHYSGISAAVYIASNGAFAIYEDNVNRGVLGSVVTGDVFRIAREGSSVNYYRNRKLLRSISVDPLRYYLADASIRTGSVHPITLSFDRNLRVKSLITIPNESTNVGGAITSTAQGGYAPITTSWSTGESTADITNKARGVYTITATDQAARTYSRTYELGYPVHWTDLQNAQLISGNSGSIEKIGTQQASDAGAISSNALGSGTNGWIEFVVNETGYDYIIGLASINSLPTLAIIDYGIRIGSGGSINVYELGTPQSVVGYVVRGDVLRVAREGSNIVYRLNGQQLRSVATTPTRVLYADCSIITAQGRMPTVTASFGNSIQTYYAIANGNWNSGTTWSLTENGAAAQSFPGVGDRAVVKGFNVLVTTGFTCSDVDIIVTTSQTALVIDGSNAKLNVSNRVAIQGANNADTANALIVRNNGSIAVQN